MSEILSPPRIFLSYARGDDEPFVQRLHADLTTVGFTVWFDRQTLMSRGLTFHQEIKDAIRTEVDRVVYVGGPKAALSANVREEWQFALECDHVVVVPILRLGGRDNVPGELSLLHTEDFRDDAKYPTALAKLIAHLRLPVPKLGALFAVPSLPPHFLGRPELMDRVRDALLVDLQKPQVITGADARVGMQGMGGIGKSVLAAALARNREIRQAYPDGVIWISCGQNLSRDDLLQRQRDLAKHLGGDKPFDSLPQGQGVLRELLAAKAVLLILDDAWQAVDAQAFDVLGPRCRMLVTTRDAGILHALHGEQVPVSFFTEPEALQLLADATGVEPNLLPAEAREVVSECGCLPLAISLSGGMAKAGHSWRDIVAALREADLEWAENREGANEQHRTIWNAMKASVDVLTVDEQQRFAELAVFGADSTVPEAALRALWAHAGQLSDRNCAKLLLNLAQRSLVQSDLKVDTTGKTHRYFRLHDLLHDYAVRIAGEPKALHQKIVDGYREKCSGTWHTGPNDGYFFENLATHLAAAGAWPDAEALLTNFSWLMRKCELGLLESIANDHGMVDRLASIGTKQRLKVWQSFFREKSHILRRGNATWPAHKILLQLAVEHADNSPLTIAAERWLTEGCCDWFWLRRIPRLAQTRENPCLATMEGHAGPVHGAVEIGESRFVSWSDDSTLRMWDSQTGACLAILQCYGDRPVGALSLKNGRLLSWSHDIVMRLWDLESGICCALLRGYTNRIHGALELRDERLLSWGDATPRIWNARSGECVASLAGHTSGVNGVVELSDGRLLSWSADGTLRLWDSQTTDCLAILEGHTDAVRGVKELADGRLLSWSFDRTFRRWDVREAIFSVALKVPFAGVAEVRELRDKRVLLRADRDGLPYLLDFHTREFKTVTVNNPADDLDTSDLAEARLWVRLNAGTKRLSNGQFLSWHDDYSLCTWDGTGQACLATMRGHTDNINGVIELADGRLLSWSRDRTLRLWQSRCSSPPAALRWVKPTQRRVLASARGKFLALTGDHALRLWDSESGSPIAEICAEGNITITVPISDSRVLVIYGSPAVHDGRTGKVLVSLEGHSLNVIGARELVDGNLLSWSQDRTLRLWDSSRGTCLSILRGHTATIAGAKELADGRLLSWSWDKSLRLWNIKTGACLLVLNGHTDWVTGALELDDGRLVSWSADMTLRVWDAQRGTCLATCNGHTGKIESASALTNGTILSWGGDGDLRIWDSGNGRCLLCLGGHTAAVSGGLEMTGDRLLSWSLDNTVRLWDRQNGQCLETVPEDDLILDRPEWLHALEKIRNPTKVIGNFVIRHSPLTLELRGKSGSLPFAAWQSEFDSDFRCLMPDGEIVGLEETGQVCLLRLCHGVRRIPIAEAEAFLPEATKSSD